MSNRRRYPTAPPESTYGQQEQPNFNPETGSEVAEVPMINVEDEIPLVQVFQTEDQRTNLAPEEAFEQEEQSNEQVSAQLVQNSQLIQQNANQAANLSEGTLNQPLSDELTNQISQYYDEKRANQPEKPKIQKSDIIVLTNSIIPYSQAELAKFRLPVGFVFQPLENIDIPSIDYNHACHVNPPRCSNCKAYVNCYSRFTSAGHHICNICGSESTFDFEYERMIKTAELRAQRPEYTHEAYTIEAPDIYRVRKAESFETYALVFDVSAPFVESGRLQQCIDQVVQRLSELKQQKMRTMVSITLVNTAVHYVIFKQKQYEIFTVPAIDDTFIPAPRDVIVSLSSRGTLVLDFLRKLPEVARKLPQNVATSEKSRGKKADELCLLNSITGVYNCMSGVGGKICYFVNAGNGCGQGFSAKKPNKSDLKTNFQPISEFVDLGTKCALAYVSVDGYLLNMGSGDQNDVSSLSELSRISSGYLHTYDDLEHETALFYQHLDASFDNFTSLESCTRIRMSGGVDCKYFYGKGQNGSLNLLNLSHLDEDETFGAEFTITEPLKMNQYVFVQLSVLYTDKYNRRFIRVVTKACKVGSTINFYNSVAPEACAALLCKKIAIAMRPQTYIDSESSIFVGVDVNKTKHKGQLSSNADFTTFLDGLMGQIMECYSHYSFLTNLMTVQQFPTQMQKLLTFLFSITKTPFCRPEGARFGIDERAAFLHFVEGATTQQIIEFIYPLVYASTGNRMRLYLENLDQTQPYVGLIYDKIIVYFGDQMQPQLVAQYCCGDIDFNQFLQLGDETDVQQKLQDIVEGLRQEVGFDYPIYAISGTGRHKQMFISGMIESRVDGLGWADFLKLLVANEKKE